jgi:hypothetical protein
MCIIFNLLATLFEITTPNLYGTYNFHSAIGLKKIGVHKKFTILSSWSHWWVRTNETFWSFTGDYINIIWLGVVDLIEIGEA